MSNKRTIRFSDEAKTVEILPNAFLKTVEVLHEVLLQNEKDGIALQADEDGNLDIDALSAPTVEVGRFITPTGYKSFQLIGYFEGLLHQMKEEGLAYEVESEDAPRFEIEGGNEEE